MRRMILSLAMLGGISLLSACGGTGFQGPSNGTIDNVGIVEGGSPLGGGNQPNDFFLAPNPIQPLQLSAFGYTGTGVSLLTVPDTTFTWTVAYAPDGTTYHSGVVPTTNHDCATPPYGSPADVFYTQQVTGASGASPYVAYVPGTATSQIYVEPAAGATAPYCLNVTATQVGSNKSKTVVVVVSNSP